MKTKHQIQLAYCNTGEFYKFTRFYGTLTMNIKEENGICKKAIFLVTLTAQLHLISFGKET